MLLLLFVAQTIVDMAKNTTDQCVFSEAILEELGEFEFPDYFMSDVWTKIGSTRGTSL